MDDIRHRICNISGRISGIIDSISREIKTYFLKSRQVCTIDKVTLGTSLRGIGGIERATSGQQKAC